MPATSFAPPPGLTGGVYWLPIALGAIAAGTAVTGGLPNMKHTGEVFCFECVDTAAITANDTNYATFTLKIGATTVIALSTTTAGTGTSTGSFVAGVPYAADLTAISRVTRKFVGGNVANSRITVAKTFAGSGVAQTNFVAWVGILGGTGSLPA